MATASRLSKMFYMFMALGLCCLSAETWALSLGPALFKVQHIPPGKAIDIKKAAGVSFVVTNNSDKEEQYALVCCKPFKGGLSDWEAGYDEILDPAWCKLEKNEFAVAAKSRAEIGLTIEIPDKPEHYNCKWLLVVVLTSGGAKGIGVGLAVASRVQIETLPSKDTGSGNAAALATIPSTLDIEVAPGAVFTETIVIRNNTGKNVSLSSERLNEVYPEKLKHERYTSGGFVALIDESWLKQKPPALVLQAGKHGEINLAGTVPQDAKPGEKREELVFLRAEETEPKTEDNPRGQRPLRTFVRVRYTVVAPGAKPQPPEK